MTHNDLVAKLKEMLASAKMGVDITATVLLFGILFNEQIKNSDSDAAKIAGAIEKKYSPMINGGQKLAELKFVEPTAEMVSRWTPLEVRS